ncbi:MAG: fructose-bisphosphate aldolase, partial [Actinobacteria bacterium]|nr:fructose-bisphosphate aldolase [Actinomycetota bacterium]
IGNSHGLNKFEGKPELKFDILQEINKNIPGVPLVLHGASSLPEKYVSIISEYGGTLKKVTGVPMDQIIKATKLGIKKINIYTDLTLCMMASVRRYLFNNPAEIDPRKYLGSCRDEISGLVSEKMQQFGLVNRTAGLAAKK